MTRGPYADFSHVPGPNPRPWAYLADTDRDTDEEREKFVPSRLSEDALRAAYERRHTINVADHGAVGDYNGTAGTDNLAAFDAAAAQILVAGQPARIVIPAGRYWLSDNWLVDGEDIEVDCDPGAEIITTAPTTWGMTVGFTGHGIPDPPNQSDPQRGRCSWRGGKITATGSGTMDNGLGFSRYRSCHVADLIVDADRKGLTAQYGVDNITWERVRIDRAGVSGVTVETDCNRVRLRDIHVVTAAEAGVHVTSGDLGQRNSDVLLDGVVVEAAATGLSFGLTDWVTIRASRVVAATTQGMYVSAVTGLTIDGASRLGTIVYGADVTPAPPPAARPLALGGSWVANGAPYAAPAVRVTPDGFAVLEGAAKNGATSSGSVVATLPADIRPTVRRRLLAEGNAGPAIGLYLEPADGTIRLTSTISTSAFLSLDGVMFPIA